MSEAFHAPHKSLVETLVETWAAQGRDGFLLADPASVDMLVSAAVDRRCGVTYRFRWMPHREIRGDVKELERRGILNKRRDQSKLFRDPRDPRGNHCFLCPENIAECNPKEVLIPLQLADQEYVAGANFAWIEPDHFTVMSAEHVDQEYSRHVLEAMLDLHLQTAGEFRVLFNGPGAGASIQWHRHFQITTAPLPIERLHRDEVDYYPTAVCRFPLDARGPSSRPHGRPSCHGQLLCDRENLCDPGAAGTLRFDGLEQAHFAAERWLSGDPENRSLNLLVATVGAGPCIFLFPRDQRFSNADGKGMVGGFEVAGDFVLSAPGEETAFRNASVGIARNILSQVCPPGGKPLCDWMPSAVA